MTRDNRFSGALHVLMHVHEAAGVVTSEALAPRLDTNPVVQRGLPRCAARAAAILRRHRDHTCDVGMV